MLRLQVPDCCDLGVGVEKFSQGITFWKIVINLQYYVRARGSLIFLSRELLLEGEMSNPTVLTTKI